MQKLLTVKQVAEVLLLHPNQVYKLIASGKLVAHKIGGVLRVSEPDLDEYVHSCRLVSVTKTNHRPVLKNLKI